MATPHATALFFLLEGSQNLELLQKAVRGERPLSLRELLVDECLTMATTVIFDEYCKA